jgi:hypothetical protein
MRSKRWRALWKAQREEWRGKKKYRNLADKLRSVHEEEK